MTERLTRGLLAGLVLVYLLLAGAYSALTPAATADQHNPDENAHMIYVQTVALGHLPVFTDAQHGYENHQPPLYYMLAAPVYLAAKGQGDAAATKAVRWVSVVLGALLIFAAYGAGRVFMPADPWLALGTAVFVGLLPANVALNASVTNDSLTTLVSVAALWLLGRIIHAEDDASRVRLTVWLGVTLGLAVWTKSLTLSLYPTVAMTFLLLARYDVLVGVPAARLAGLALGLGGLIGLPWLVRNTFLYGDPLAQRLLLVTLNNGANNVPIDAMIALFGGMGGYFAKVAQWAFSSFWGGFDSMRLFWDQDPRRPHPNFLRGLTPTYQVLLLVSLAPVFGLVRQWRRWAAPAVRRVGLLLLAAQLVFAGIAFLNYNLHFFQAQGRYLFPALFPLAFFFVLGWRGLLPRPTWFPAFVGFLAAGLLALNLYTLLGLLLPRFS